MIYNYIGHDLHVYSPADTYEENGFTIRRRGALPYSTLPCVGTVEVVKKTPQAMVACDGVDIYLPVQVEALKGVPYAPRFLDLYVMPGLVAQMIMATPELASVWQGHILVSRYQVRTRPNGKVLGCTSFYQY